MTQTEVIQFLAGHLQMSQKEAKAMLEDCVDVFKSCLDGESDIYIPGLGVFHTAHRDERKGYHPLKHLTMMLPHRRVLTFHAGSNMRDRFRNGRTLS